MVAGSGDGKRSVNEEKPGKIKVSDIDELVEGCKLKAGILISGEQQMKEAEILSIRDDEDGRKRFFVSYLGHDPRCNQWIAEESLDLQEVIMPAPTTKDQNPSKTTRRNSLSSVSQRKTSSSARNANFITPISSIGSTSRNITPTGSQNTSKFVTPRTYLLKRTSSTNVSSNLNSPGDFQFSTPSPLFSRNVAQILGSQKKGEGPIRNIEWIQIGFAYRMQPWYFSPYPIELVGQGTIYLCEFCLKPLGSDFSLMRHIEGCPLTHPPGKEVYRKDSIAFFEIDGDKNSTFARNLCLLSKLFLEHKILDYDPSPFLFYVLTEQRDTGDHIVGYFSKEKKPDKSLNLSCILILPYYQRRGFGELLIEFSYELSKLEGKTGTPEKPLSDLGRVSYTKYWFSAIVGAILKEIDSAGGSREPGRATNATISIVDLERSTRIDREDIRDVLEEYKMYASQDDGFVITLTSAMIKKFEEARKKQKFRIDPSEIHYEVRWWRVESAPDR